ncbi:recombinase family protein [Vibrio parahaemolyticus]|uniref:recombinase family protein n=1 Tax=Vibrio parahaemolyticus TaxID=670 RepID=UPI000A431581|nr:recombinase family protein [Vibrio parahaemolyticus]
MTKQLHNLAQEVSDIANAGYTAKDGHKELSKLKEQLISLGDKDVVRELEVTMSKRNRSNFKAACAFLSTCVNDAEKALANAEQGEKHLDLVNHEPQGQLIGFARVSTQGQDLDDQLHKLELAGCSKVFSGKHSGKADVNKAALEELEQYVREGDTVAVTKLDRLGRSTSQVITLIERLQSKGVHVKTLEQGIDTSKQDAMSKAFYQMIMVFAEMERAMIESRMTEGKQAAVRSGKHTEQSVKGGRPKNYTEAQAKEVLELLDKGQSILGISKATGISRQSIYRIKDGK